MNVIVSGSLEASFDRFLSECGVMLNMTPTELQQPEWRQYWENGRSPIEAVDSLMKAIEESRPRPMVQEITSED